ncbi:FISUMP domain-containing protein [Zobellia nedashkovskayae]
MGPEDASIVRAQAKLEWDLVEAGEGEVLTYEVLLGNQNPPKEVVAEITDTSFDYDTSELVSGQTYYWQVKVSDKINKSESDVKSFIKLRPGSPDQPILTSPVNREGVKGDVALLEWTPAEDPEGDVVSYNVYVGLVNPPSTLVATVETNNYNTNLLDKNTPFFWRVEAVDPSGNFSESPTNQSFQLLNEGGPDSPILHDLEVENILSLDESLKWNISEGAVSYDVYIDDVFPPAKIVAANINESEYVVKNEDIPSTLNDIKTYYAQIVAKDEEGLETRSIELEFQPQMQGVYTDTRGNEVQTYNWLRLDKQVWMTQNLRTTKTNMSTDLINVAQGPLERNKPAYDEMPASVLGTNGLPSLPQEDWVAKNGRLYNRSVIDQNLLAPKGWHVMTTADLNVLYDFVLNDQGNPNNVTGKPQDKIVVSAISTLLYNGTDTYGLNFESAGWRSGDDALSRARF